MIPRADFATDGIESINVSLDYEGDVRNVVFDAATRRADRRVAEHRSRAARCAPTSTVSSEVTFATDGRRPAAIDRVANPRRSDGEVVEISPRASTSPTRSAGSPSTSSTSRGTCTTPSRCTASTPTRPTASTSRNQYGLTGEHNTGAWPVFAIDPAKRTVRYRLIHHGYDGRDWDSDWLETDDEQIRISDPFSNRLTVDIVVPAALFGTQLDRVFVDVSYDDPTNDVHKRESFELSAQDPATKRFTVELLDPARREVTFKVSMILADGSVVDIPESTTAQNRILVSPQMRGHRTVRITTDGGRPRRRRHPQHPCRDCCTSVPTSACGSPATVTLTPTIPHRGHVRVRLRQGDPEYQYRVTHQLENGLTRDTGRASRSAPRSSPRGAERAPGTRRESTMLQLGTGMQTIEGVTVFPDHADEEQYWYLPAHLALARRPEDDWAYFTFMKFKRAATDEGVEGGGFLMFAVELALSDDVEQAVRSKIPGNARLSVAPFDSGTVKCVALNLQGPRRHRRSGRR